MPARVHFGRKCAKVSISMCMLCIDFQAINIKVQPISSKHFFIFYIYIVAIDIQLSYNKQHIFKVLNLVNLTYEYTA